MQMTGTILDGKYELLNEIGSGGFATVYRAKQLGIDREIALKLLHPHDIDEAIIKRFDREAKILQSFQTKFIPAIYGYGIWENRPYMAMELVSGVSLADVLRRDGRMSLQRLKPIIAAVAAGLGYAHSQGVVHRDLSPSNIILVNQQGLPDARIIDFGLAAFTELDLRNRQKLTEAGYAVGSFQYMSPEQCMAEAADERSDIYALGCIIHHALSGNIPFTADNPVLLLAKHVHEPLPRLGDDFSVTLQAVLDKATAKNPANRFQSTEEFLSAWESVENAQPTRMPKWIPAPSLGLISLVMLAVTLIAFLTPHKAEAPPPEPTESAVQLINLADQLYETRYVKSRRLSESAPEMKSLIAEHFALLSKALAIETARPQLSDVQLELLYKELCWNYRRSGNASKAVEYGKRAVLLDINRHVPCTTALNGYEDAMEMGTPADQREFIEVMQKILDADPPYNAALKQAANIGIADARAHLGYVKEAWAVLPPGPEVINEVEKNYVKVVNYLRDKASP